MPDEDLYEYYNEYPEDYFDENIDEALLGTWYGSEDGVSIKTTFAPDHTWSAEIDGESSESIEIYTNAELHLMYLPGDESYLYNYFFVEDKLLLGGTIFSREEQS